MFCFWKSKDYSRWEIFSDSIHSKYTTGNPRRPLTVPLCPDHLLLAWSQKIRDIYTALVSWAARAKWKCHSLSNEVHVTHARNCSSDSYGEENKIMIFIPIYFSHMFCVGWCTVVSNLPLQEVEGWWFLLSSPLSTFMLKPEVILLHLG